MHRAKKMQSPDITCRFTMFPFANLDPNNFGQMLLSADFCRFGTSTGMRKCTCIPRISRMYIISQLPRSYTALKTPHILINLKKAYSPVGKWHAKGNGTFFTEIFAGLGQFSLLLRVGAVPPRTPYKPQAHAQYTGGGPRGNRMCCRLLFLPFVLQHVRLHVLLS
jgi:hypothetical protein